MSFVRARAIDAPDVLDAMRERTVQAPKLMETAFRRTVVPINRRLLGELATEPPVWKGKRRWKSDKQRVYVIIKLREANNLPYKRTHALVKKWRIVFEARGGIGELFAENKSPIVRYVQGDDAQPMHLDSRWPQYAPIIRKYHPIYQNALIETWYTVTDINAGVGG